MTNSDQIDALYAAKSKLPDKDLDFAHSLITQFKTKGHLSDKQWYWVGKLIKSTEPAAAAPVEKVTVGSMAGVIKLFDTAKAKGLKSPKIKLAIPTPEGLMPVQLYRCGPNAKNPGSISISAGGYGSDWYGLVSPSGEWQPSKKVDRVLSTRLVALLEALSVEPVGTAMAYGKLTGHCCFCSLPLSDPKSKTVGYGKTCAHNWGMPYGQVDQFMKTLEAA